MAIGPGGRIVLEIDPNRKKAIYARLKGRGLTLREWFLEQADRDLLGISEIQGGARDGFGTVPDGKTAIALGMFKERLHRRYGRRLKDVRLFGSRARGDHSPESDADVAVFLDGIFEPILEQMSMGDDAYDVWMETDIRIEPWAFEEASLLNPDGYRAAQLVKNILAEGIRL